MNRKTCVIRMVNVVYALVALHIIQYNTCIYPISLTLTTIFYTWYLIIEVNNIYRVVTQYV